MPELLMPAGDLEKAQIAYQYGADACYGSTSAFSMRTREIGFNYNTLKEAINYAHSIGKKFYVTLNTYPHEFEMPKIKAHVKKLVSMQPDAIIVADPGILQIITEELNNRKTKGLGDSSLRGGRSLEYSGQAPQSVPKKQHHDIEIHLSTQANATNSEAIKFWAKQGVSRVILARELSLKEIDKIRKKMPKKIMLEAFVHGAMCNSVSGRCNLSNYLSYRDANRGACVQACRWKYALVEEKRPNQYIPVDEDSEGSFIYNSKDLNMIEHLNELRDAGVESFKVEGRNKSIYYCAIVARAYRKAIDHLSPVIARRDDEAIFNNKKIATPKGLAMTKNKKIKELTNELNTVTNRGYSTGFYFGKPSDADINYQTSRPESEWQFVGIIKKQLSCKEYLVEARNELKVGTKVEIITPNEVYKTIMTSFISQNKKEIEKANPNTEFVFTHNEDLPINSFLRAKNKQIEK